jgi:vancomycin resistance protein YoaR
MGDRRRLAGRVTQVISALLLAAGGIWLWQYFSSVSAPATIAGVRVAGTSLGAIGFPDLDAKVAAAADHFLDETIVLKIGEQRVRARRREAGFVVDRKPLVDELRTLGKSGDPMIDIPLRGKARRGELDLKVAISIDRPRALELLTEIKEAVDRAPVDAKLDLEHHAVAGEKPGILLQVYESLGAVEEGAQSGAPEIELKALTTPAKIKKEDLGSIEIGTVLGTWETHYSSIGPDSDRTYNLKVGAEHLNGHILQPHELFSFNEIVGDRTEKEGYRIAPVIAGGELVDGLAGGMCQIASTLHAAAFFAGLDIVSSTPHSRPSAYIPMGLDSTVVYPTTDLQIRNPFDFPIVMHYSVHQGTVKVELLGRMRPYKVVFEREILEENGFPTQSRADPEAPAGQKLVLQEGYPGYRATRRRYRFEPNTKLPRSLGAPKDSIEVALAKAKVKPVSVEKWTIHYPATTQMMAVGSGSKSLKKKPQLPAHHIPPVAASEKPFSRILR